MLAVVAASLVVGAAIGGSVATLLAQHRLEWQADQIELYSGLLRKADARERLHTSSRDDSPFRLDARSRSRLAEDL